MQMVRASMAIASFMALGLRAAKAGQCRPCARPRGVITDDDSIAARRLDDRAAMSDAITRPCYRVAGFECLCVHLRFPSLLC